MFSLIIKYYKTIKHLKKKQIIFIFFFKIKILFKLKKINFLINVSKEVNLINFNFLKKKNTYLGNNNFNFLNINKTISSINDINNLTIEKLWIYNFFYFDFINSYNSQNFFQENKIYVFDGIRLRNKLKYFTDSYVISIQIVNLIKWYSKYHLLLSSKEKEIILDYIFSANSFLKKNIEYNIDANHLFTNLKTLVFVSIFFNEKKYNIRSFNKFKKKFLYELNNQIFSDGGHYERSPMYHSILLEDIIEVRCFGKIYNYFSASELALLDLIIYKMFSWLNHMSFSNEISFFNDSCHGISSSINDLIKLLNENNIKYEINKNSNDKLVYLRESGYFVSYMKNSKLIVDVGNASPSFQPGHYHAQSLSFEFMLDNIKVFTNSGISTYENNQLRFDQRSTKSHNTVIINNENSSEIWSSFRLANRANVKVSNFFISNDNNTIELEASHDGYKKKSSNIHTRKFKYEDKSLKIYDKVTNLNCNIHAVFMISSKFKIKDQTIYDNNGIKINFKTNGIVKIYDSYFYPEFNKKIKTKKILIKFQSQNLTTQFYW